MIHSIINEREDHKQVKAVKRAGVLYLVSCIIKMIIFGFMVFTSLLFKDNYSEQSFVQFYALVLLIAFIDVVLIVLTFNLTVLVFSQLDLSKTTLGKTSTTITCVVAILDIITSLLVEVSLLYGWIVIALLGVTLISELVLIVLSLLTRRSDHE